MIPLVHWLCRRENPSSRPAFKSAPRSGRLSLGLGAMRLRCGRRVLREGVAEVSLDSGQPGLPVFRDEMALIPSV